MVKASSKLNLQTIDIVKSISVTTNLHMLANQETKLADDTNKV